MGTVAKALSLLDLFTLARPEIGLSDLARLSGMNKATVYRMVSELQAEGLLEQTGTRAYRIGPAVLRLAALREATVPLRAAAMPLLQRLSDRTGETVHLSFLEGGKLGTYAFTYADAHGTSVRMEDAAVLPFHATASGLAVLAYLPPDRREALLTPPLAGFTAATQTDAARIRAALSQVRASGIAVSTGGFEADVSSLAVPLFAADGSVTGALAVATPVSRMTDALRARIAQALTDTAPALGALWGASPLLQDTPPPPVPEPTD
ncbi:IclR family transcriptional regulator [Anianabacter salinae]|uniref:IclR family transcriptional regulator n=1 Tax=Anianabacter salinae TaxID=2851023 RepID=UPI00225E2C96|nr:IclR family transcriptional regulator [Anianabacter salinae]MBV0911776.1 IclR family transcriptional regulator [Anianabacter salinae]